MKQPRRDHWLIQDITSHILSVARHEGAVLERGATVLDFGCGVGDMVKHLLDGEFDAYGVDINEYWGKDFEEYWEERPKPDDPGLIKRLQKLDLRQYTLPFPEEYFDFVFSDTVFEHVMDYEVALKEIHRVLKRGAISVNLFPDIFNLFEAHTLVPVVPLCKYQGWLKLWAILGRRAPSQRNRKYHWREVVELNRKLLANTNHLTNVRIRQIAEGLGIEVYFPGAPIPLSHMGRLSRYIKSALDKFRLGDPLTRLLRPFLSSRILVIRKL